MWRALQLKESHQISYWDAAIVSAALRFGCRELYSEDLSPGQIYDGVRLINPFAQT